MITSRTEYKNYLSVDKIALRRLNLTKSQLFIEFFFPNYIWKFQKLLRKCEYYKNCRKDIISKIYYFYIKIKFKKLSLKLGFSIPENVFGPGLAIVHYGTIVVSTKAQIGKNCRIHPSVGIGSSGGYAKAPKIGDNVYIGPGAKIYGDIVIGNNVAIAANAAVGSSFTEENIMIGGVPAKKIQSVEIKNLIKHIA